jgi:hypothetical protein
MSSSFEKHRAPGASEYRSFVVIERELATRRSG